MIKVWVAIIIVLFLGPETRLASQIDFRSIVTWGDSLTAADYPKILAEKTGMEVVNGGVNGQTSSQIAARMLAAPHLYRCPTILWAGRNNYDQAQSVLRDLEAMVSALAVAGNTNRFLVLGVINSSYGGYEDRGTLPYRLIVDLNRTLEERFGDRFVPVRDFLIGAYDPKQAGDRLDFAHDVPPGSLRSDALHLNESGYEVLVDYLVQHKMALLRGDWGWVEKVSLRLRSVRCTLQADVRMGWQYRVESSEDLIHWRGEFAPIWPETRTLEWELPLSADSRRFFRLQRLSD
jgi:lysophospholipase L1-like esterase